MMSSGDSPTHDFDFTNPTTTPSPEKRLPYNHPLSNRHEQNDVGAAAAGADTSSKYSPKATTSHHSTGLTNNDVEMDRIDHSRNVEAAVTVDPDATSDNGGGGDGDGEEKIDGGKRINNGEYGPKDKRERKDEKFRKNGNLDKLDGVWLTKGNKKPQNEKEGNNCIVDCLYYTNACCDCSIM